MALTQTSPATFSGEKDGIDAVDGGTQNCLAFCLSLVTVANGAGVVDGRPLGVLFANQAVVVALVGERHGGVVLRFEGVVWMDDVIALGGWEAGRGHSNLKTTS